MAYTVVSGAGVGIARSTIPLRLTNKTRKFSANQPVYVTSDGSKATFDIIRAALQSPKAKDKSSIGKIAVLSVRPDGPRMDLLSIICVLPEDLAAAFGFGLTAADDATGLVAAAAHTTIRLRAEASALSLDCTWASTKIAHRSQLLRLICSSDYWHARHAMASRRLSMTLAVSMPGFTAEVNFTTEAISALMHPARVSVCLDLQYTRVHTPQ